MANTIINTPELLNLDSTTGATVLAKGTVNQRPPSPGFSLDYLVVAGGGGASGGTYNGQGGGGGGYLTGTLSISIGNSHTLTVGDGGASTNNGAGTNGDNSVFSSIISPGGGGGGAGSASTGGNGGSGGAGSIQGGTGSAGFNGGVGDGINGWVAGGGGGAAAVGGSITGASNTWYAGDGGNGATPSIITAAQATTLGIGEVVNNVLYLAGGGAGGGYNYPGYAFNPGSGGLGGGGNGSSSTNGTDGLANTGGGGGGGNSRTSATGGQGGSGVVVLKYPTAYTITVGSGIQEASGSPFADGSGNTISVYTSGTGTISFSGTVVVGDNDATDGALRFNTDTNKTEYFDGANWYEIVDEYASGFVGPATNYFDTKLYTGNGAAQSIGGYINGSGSFNGSSSNINIGGNIVNSLTKLSVSMWVYWDGTNSGDDDYFIALGKSSSGKIFSADITNSTGIIGFYDGASVLNSTGAVSANTWTHIVLTADATVLKIYLNGSLDSTHTISSLNFDSSGNAGFIGSWITGTDYEFDGSIDQVRIYNTALSSADVAALNLETAATASTAAFPSGQTAIATYTMDTSANGLLTTTDLSTVDYPSGAGCMALYEMNGNSNDTSGTYNGTPTNITYEGGAFDKAAVFGSSSNILLPSNLISGTTDSDYSVSLWVKFDTLPGANFAPLIGQLSNTSAFRLLLYHNSGSTYNVGVMRTFGGTYYYNSPNTAIQGTFNVGQYYNVIVTYQSSNKLVNGYLNGNSIGSYTLNASGSGAAGAPALGTYNGTTSYSFDGSMDQVRIFNTVLTQSQVTTLARGIATSYSGTATNVNFNGKLDFQPDFVWIKERSNSAWHILTDSVRGANKTIYSNDTYLEESLTDVMNSFDNNGFTVGYNSAYSSVFSNKNNEDYVSWNWKAGGAAVANNEGTIASQVSANKDSGFSIVKYTGNSSTNQTIGHGLFSPPELIFIKNRDDGTANWLVAGENINYYLNLNRNIEDPSSSSYNWITNIGADTFTVGSQRKEMNQPNEDFVAYCFHSVALYSKIGTYTGTGSTDGPTVNIGFEPAWLMIKKTNGTGQWLLVDNARNPSNPVNARLRADKDNAESTSYNILNFLSNGFKIITADNDQNTNNGNYLYMAFA